MKYSSCRQVDRTRKQNEENEYFENMKKNKMDQWQIDIEWHQGVEYFINPYMSGRLYFERFIRFSFHFFFLISIDKSLSITSLPLDLMS